MYDQNYYLNLAADLIVGDSYPDLPRELQEPMINEEMLQDFALVLRRDYPNAVQRSTWTAMNLRQAIDTLLDESDPIVRHAVFDDRFFNESERQEILNRCAETARKKLQRYIGAYPKVCYKVMQNGRVGYRLE